MADVTGHLTWRKSSRSGNGNNCVEVANLDDAVLVRDSKNPTGGVLRVPNRVWGAFLGRIREGAYDL